MFRNVNGLTGGREAERNHNLVYFSKKADYSTSRYSFKKHRPVLLPVGHITLLSPAIPVVACTC